jgi:hypothetical protein
MGMGQLLALVALVVGLVVYLVQRNRRMARVVADSEGDAPLVACAVMGAQELYDEVRWLRIALEIGERAMTRVDVHTAGGNGVGIAISHGSAAPDLRDQHEHASRLAQALHVLPDAASEVLRARAIDADLARVAEQAASNLDPRARASALETLRRAELVLTTA